MTYPRIPSVDAARFGAIIRRLRLERGWTKAKLAQRADITPQYMNIVENGYNVPSLTLVLDLLEVLGADGAAVMRELLANRNFATK